MDYSPSGSSGNPWDSPDKKTGVGCHCLLQGIFPTQESNPGLFLAGKFFTDWAMRTDGPWSPSNNLISKNDNLLKHEHWWFGQKISWFAALFFFFFFFLCWISLSFFLLLVFFNFIIVYFFLSCVIWNREKSKKHKYLGGIILNTQDVTSFFYFFFFCSLPNNTFFILKKWEIK